MMSLKGYKGAKNENPIFAAVGNIFKTVLMTESNFPFNSLFFARGSSFSLSSSTLASSTSFANSSILSFIAFFSSSDIFDPLILNLSFL